MGQEKSPLFLSFKKELGKNAIEMRIFSSFHFFSLRKLARLSWHALCIHLSAMGTAQDENF